MSDIEKTPASLSVKSGGIPTKSRVARGSNSKPTVKNRGFRRRTSVGKKDTEQELDDDEQCIICAEKIVYAALTSCSHKTCHKCTLRQRALYNKTKCMVCRSENEIVIITELHDKEFSDISRSDIVRSDDKYKLDFTSNYSYDDSMKLLKNSCNVCSSEFPTFKELGEHAKVEHGKFYCFICSEHKKAFVTELEMYSYKQLLRHQSQGDIPGFKGHPECKYCLGRRFYSEDELNYHIRDRHERCHICDQHLPKTADYYRNYDSLYNHFKKDHYVCTVPICIEKKFVVFRDDLDLTAHMLKDHGGLGNNKIVIGSNGFRSQLSTFNESASRVNASLRTNNEEEDHNSPEVKKKRFEERAKHYVNYDQTKLQTFLNLNASYRSRKIDSQVLYDQYKTLFEKESVENLSLLLNEFAELFPKSSELHQNLQPVLNSLNQLTAQNQFPVLGGSSGVSSPRPSWVVTPTKKGLKNTRDSNDLFPTLAKSNKLLPKINNAPLRYTKVLNPAPKSKVTVNSTMSNFTPNYLDNLKTKSSPALGSSRSSPTPSVQVYSNSRNGSSTSVNDSKFPALQQKPKKIIPRVNPINVADPSKWGVISPVSPPPKEDPIDFGVGVVVKKGKKRR